MYFYIALVAVLNMGTYPYYIKIMKSLTVYTLGRGNLTFEGLVDVLKKFSIKTIVDVRMDSESDGEPSFRHEWLRGGLMKEGMIYHWAIMQLGGIRPVVGNSRHTALKEENLKGFADFMDSDNFQRGLGKLKNISDDSFLLLGDSDMPEKCHRSLISDYLVFREITVLHILKSGKTEAHVLRSAARPEGNFLIYDRS